MKIARPLLVTIAAGCAPAAAATTVPVPQFDSIELRGGGHVVLEHGAVQTVRLLQGSTAYTHMHIDAGDTRKLIIDACNMDCPHHYNLQIEIVTPKIEGVAISGGGKIDTNGAFPGQHSITTAVHGGGTIDVRGIDATDATAAVDGGGEIRVKSRDRLTAAINGGGKIRYWGNPNVTEAVNGGGNVSKGG